MVIETEGFCGAYSEAAAEKAYPSCEAVPCEEFDVAFEAFKKWVMDKAVLPIEDSLGRSIHRNYEHFLRHSLCIVEEVKLTVRHCLFAYHSVKIEDLGRVLGHSQYDAITQFKNRLTKLSLGREAVDDTAFAAELVSPEL